MSKKIEIKNGDRFGRLRIIDEAPEFRDKNGTRKRIMVCKCDCGTIKHIRLNDLRSKKVVSCGCNKKEVSVKVGERHGNLVIEKFVERTNPNYPRVGLKCDCGNYIEIDVKNLNKKKDKSCGCIKLSKIKNYGYVGLPFNFGDKRYMLKYIRDVEPDIQYFKKDGNDKEYIKKTKLIEVECDCGKVIVQNYSKVKAGRIKSCGCSTKRLISEGNKGRESPKKIHFTEEQVDRMVELHSQGVAINEIGREYGVTQNPIKVQLKLRGRIVGNRRYKVTENYFKTVDSEEKAYWLGFLAADGCIRRRVNEKGKSRGDGIYLKLAVLDESHMEKFRDSICPDAKITYQRNKTVTKSGKDSFSNSCNLRINGNELVQDIIKLGVGPRKTFTVGKPNIGEEYYKHFIRGFFDGDGCCYVKKTLGKRGLYTVSVRFSFACASKDMRDFFAEELGKIGIDTKCYDNLNLQVTGGFINDKKFFDYLYTDATIYLQRKYDKGMIFVEHFNNLPKDIFINEYVYNPDISKPDEVWTEEELKILIDTNDKIPYSYLSGGYIPNKSKQQIFRMRKKLGLKARRKVPGYLNMRKEMMGY